MNQELIVCGVCKCLREEDKVCAFCAVDHIISESAIKTNNKHIKIPNYDYVLDGEYNDPLYQAYLNNPEILDNIEEET
tara:strand:- start:241 stop:474 length:234 start_codon:yes stop_codon:yes gene_type:complete